MRVAVLAFLVSACGAKEASEDYLRKSKQIEGRGALPTGTIGPTPAQPCCASADKKCPANAADWQHPIWDQPTRAMARASQRLRRVT